MKTKFTRIIPVLVGLFLLITTSARAQNQPGYQRNSRLPDFRNFKGMGLSPYSGMAGMKRNVKQAILKEASLTNDNHSNVKLIGRWGNGFCYGVATDSNYVYFGNGAYFEIATLHNTPKTILGKVLLPSIVNTGIAIQGHYAYIADTRAGLRIVDIKDPSYPKEVGFFETNGWVVGVALASHYAYVADENYGLYIIDVSNPLKPVEAGSFSIKGGISNVTVSGHYAYVADGKDGLQIIDINDAAHPVKKGFYNTGDDAIDIDVMDTLAYVADRSDGLRILNIKNPQHITEVGFFNTSGEVNSVILRGHYAFLTYYSSGLRIIDISNPASPVEKSFFDTDNIAFSIAVSGNNIFVANTNSMVIFSIMNLSSPVKIQTFKTGGVVYNLAVAGHYAYLVERWKNQLHILDIKDPSQPKVTATFHTKGYPQAVTVNRDYAYVADDWDGLRIINISDPAHPVETGFFDTGGNAIGVTVNGDYAYVADYNDGLRIINISDPTHPVKTGFFDTDGSADGVAVNGDYAYVADGSDGLRIINISDPAHPVETGFFDTGGHAIGVTINGDYAYVADGWGGLRIINISNPANPVETGSFDTGSSAYGVTVNGDYAYVADGSLRIINISDPTHPVETDDYITGDWTSGITIANGLIYLADGRDGMYILGSSTLPRSLFKPVWSGNPYQPMAVLVKDATLFGDSLQPDDEIGVFTKDSLGNEICVGDARVDTTLPHRSPLNITVSADDPTTAALDGFRNGDTIYYKIWSEKKQKVFSNIVPVYNKIYDTTFNALGTAVVSLYGFGHYKTVWEGNPYQPMNILIDTIVVPDSGLHPNDEIGLFNTDKAGNEICVGTGIVSGTVSSKHPLTVVASADDPATPKTDGFTSHHTIIYKLWSSVSQKEYTRYVARYNPAFDSLYSPLGTSLVGISFIKMVSQKIPLITGWNIMSFNTVPDTLNMLSLVNPLVSSGSLVKVIDEKGGFVQNIPGNGWMNTIGDMANTEGYYINVSHDDTLQTTGKQVILPFTIPLQTGWNLMGYPLRQRQDAITALNKLIDSSRLVKVVDEKGGFIQNIPGVGWMNTLGNFEPDKGYYIKVTKNTRLTLNKPTKAAPVSGIPFTGHPVLASQYFNKAFKANPYFPMDIVVTHIRFNGHKVQPEDEIAVFDKGVCVGTGVVPEDTSRPILIVASQDDPSTAETDGYRVGDPITFRYMSAGLVSPVEADPKVISGKLSFSPLATTVCGITASPEKLNHSKTSGYQLHFYPNPASRYVTFDINNPQTTRLELEVVDLTGKRQKVLNVTQNGTQHIRCDLSGLAPGFYFVRLIDPDSGKILTKNQKMVIVK